MRQAKRNRPVWPLAAGAVLMLAPHAAGTDIVASWVNPVSGAWTDPTKWSSNPDYPNNATNLFYTAVIDRTGAPYTITVDSPIILRTLFLNSPDARLALADGTFSTGAFGTLNIARGRVDVAGATVFTNHARLFNGSQTALSSGTFEAILTELQGASFTQTGGVHRARDGLTVEQGSAYHLSGGTLLSSPNNYFGFGGNNTFTMTGGTFVQGGHITATGAVGHASFIIDGPDARYLRAPAGEDTNLIGIGTGATGTMHVGGGATAELGLSEIGLSRGSGTLVVESGATATAQRIRAGFGTWEIPPNPGHETRGTGNVVVRAAVLEATGWPQQLPEQPTVEIGTTAFAGTLGSATLRLADNGALRVHGLMRVNLTGAATIEDAVFTSDALHVAAGSITFAGGSLETGALGVSGAGGLGLTPGRDKTVFARSLTIDAARIDLSDNRMIVDYTGASPITTVRAYVAQAHAGGAWTGDGLTSSAAAVNAGYGIGYAEASDLFTSFPSSFGGYEVDASAVLITYTRYGDANLDHLVNLADFNRLAGHFGSTDAVWSEGDFNYDGVVNLSDFNLLAGNFGLSSGADGLTPRDWASLAAAAPEPSLGAALVLLPVLARHRRRRT